MKAFAIALALAALTTAHPAAGAAPLAGSTCESAQAVATGGSAGVLLNGAEQWWIRSGSGRLGVSGAGVQVMYYGACGEPDGNCANSNPATVGIGCSQAAIVRVVNNGFSAAAYTVTVT